MSPRVLVGLLGALLAHGILILVLLWLPHSTRPPNSPWLQLFDIGSGTKPQPTPPALPQLPPQPQQAPRARALPRSPQAPIPNKTPPRTAPTAEPSSSTFGVTQASVAPDTATTTNTVALGNTTIASPNAQAAPAAPLPAPPPAASPSPENIITALPVPPTAVAGSCNIPDYAYPQEARVQGIQGITQLHILLDETGRVKKARITRSADTWLDQTALFWVETRCRFNPGQDASGRPVPSVMVQTYDWRILRQDTWNRSR